MKGVFKINYMFFHSLYSVNCFTDINYLLLSIKRVIPLLLSVINSKTDLLFIGTRFLYSKTMSKKIFLTHQLTIRNPGIFSNFSITSFYTMYKIALKDLPKIIFFFFLKENDSLLKEAKIKNIPIVALVSSKDNLMLIDYPIMIDSSYFSTIYFFSLFYFRLLRFN